MKSEKIKLPIFLTLSIQTSVFLLIFTIFSFFFYIIADFQNFSEENLLLILRIAQFSSIALCIFCLSSIFSAIFCAISKKHARFLFFALTFGIIFIFAFGFSLLCATLFVISSGLGGQF